MNKPDFYINWESSLVLLTPRSQAAKDWIDEHIQDDALYLGVHLCIEHRYIEDIIHGIQNDGLTILDIQAI